MYPSMYPGQMPIGMPYNFMGVLPMAHQQHTPVSSNVQTPQQHGTPIPPPATEGASHSSQGLKTLGIVNCTMY